MNRWILTAIHLCAALSTFGSAAAENQRAAKILAPQEGCYLGVYNWAQNGIETFEKAVGRKVAIIGGIKTYDEGDYPRFEPRWFDDWYDEGYVGIIGYEEHGQIGRYGSVDVIEGKIDAHLQAMAQAIADWGRPIFFVYNREPRLQFPVYGPDHDLSRGDAERAGFSLTAHYGDPDKLDAPEIYVGVHRHIHDVMAPIAPHITWVMGGLVAQARWDGAYADWYPGDDYVDWLAIDLYSGLIVDDGPMQGRRSSPDFVDAAEPAWSQMQALGTGKPIMILEFGANRDMPDRAKWFGGFFQAVKSTHRQVKAFLWWQKSEPGRPFDCILRADDPEAAVWRDEMSNDWWKSDVLLETDD
jgi:hypothetical protein